MYCGVDFDKLPDSQAGRDNMLHDRCIKVNLETRQIEGEIIVITGISNLEVGEQVSEKAI